MTTPTIQSFNYDVDVLAALLWQYNNAPNIQALLNAKQTWYDTNQTQFWEDFYTNIFNLATANDFGLAIWAIILDAPIAYAVVNGGAPAWGFENHKNFNQGNFAPAAGVISTYNLSTETARVILQLRYFMLTGSCTVPDINRALKYIFFENYGTAYIVDIFDMRQMYVFGFVPPSDMQFAFTNYDVLPRPAGVGSSYEIFIEPPFGFNSDAQNFNNGNFTSE